MNFSFKSKYIGYSCLLFIIGTSLIQCHKNEDLITEKEYQPVFVSGGVTGIVQDENGKPASNVKVSHGKNSVYTDQNGAFLFKDQLLDKSGAQIKFEKPNYFVVHRTVIPVKAQISYLDVRLIPKNLRTTFSSTTGSIITGNGNSSVIIEANSIVDSKGILYNGMVNAYTYWLDPSNNTSFEQMPGNLTGRNIDGEERALQTFGMMAVELEDPSGNLLNIAPGKTAELKFPIPSNMTMQADSEIPLWYYDITKAVWIEEGIASKVGSDYIGHVSHFSFWNCDFPFPLVIVKGKVVDQSEIPLAFAKIEIEDKTRAQKGYGYTNLDGSFEGKIPASSSFVMNVLANECLPAYETNFFTGTINLDLGLIKSNFKGIPISGRILDCNSNPLSNAYINLSYKSNAWTRVLPADINGQFSNYIIPCIGEEIHYKAVDINNQKESPFFSIVYNGQNELILGDIASCDTLKNTIIAYINGKLEVFQETSAQIIGQNLYIIGLTNTADSMNISINLPNTLTGIEQNPVRADVNLLLSNYYCSPCAELFCKVDELGTVGNQVRGSFRGTIRNWVTNQNVSLNGVFSVLRY